jgi:hypothetical protein
MGPGEALRRVSEAGEWFSRLLWPPATAAGKWPALELAVNLLGWLLIVLFSVRVAHALRARQWIWVATAGFVAVFFVIRWYPLPRYLAPAAPLILLGIWEGIGRIADSRIFTRVKGTVKACAVAGLISVIACNALILAVQVWIVHSPDFQKKYLGGEYLDTLRISAYLRRQGCGAGPVALVVRYADLNRSGRGGWAERSLSFMTDCRFLSPEDGIRSVADPDFIDWAERFHMTYAVTRPDRIVTRFWHFREPLFNSGGRFEQAPFYVLYHVGGGSPVPVRLPRVEGGLRYVPGLR